jgi:hypothetical protein
MFAFLKSKTFNTVFSVLLGIGIVALCKPICKGAACRIQRAPPYEEVNSSTYQLGPDCYQFRASIIECPQQGVIEPFERFVR